MRGYPLVFRLIYCWLNADAISRVAVTREDGEIHGHGKGERQRERERETNRQTDREGERLTNLKLERKSKGVRIIKRMLEKRNIVENLYFYIHL